MKTDKTYKVEVLQKALKTFITEETKDMKPEMKSIMINLLLEVCAEIELDYITALENN